MNPLLSFLTRMNPSTLLQPVLASLQQLVPADNALLMSASRYALNKPGKLIRPTVTMLLGKALTNETRPSVVEAAAVAELIHVATLLHDDVIDDSPLRRGQPTVHAQWDNRTAILSGDFLLAQASLKLAAIGVVAVIGIFSQVLADLCDGEMTQGQLAFDIDGSTWALYEQKTYGKTASLFAASAESAAILSGTPQSCIDACRAYGRGLGMAFQLMDDWLDFTQTPETLGKPSQDDLRHGLLTAPVLLALSPGALEASQAERLRKCLKTFFEDPAQQSEALDEGLLLIQQAGTIEKTRELAQGHIEQALLALKTVPEEQVKDLAAWQALIDLAKNVTQRYG